MKIISVMPFFSLFMIMPLFHSGAYIESKVLLACAIISCLTYSYKYGVTYWINKNRYEWTFILSLTLYLFVCSVFHLIHGDDMGTVRAFLYCLLFIFFSPKIELTNNSFAKIVSFGGLLLGIRVAIEYADGLPRGGVYLNEVIFAQVALAMLCCSLFSFFLHGVSQWVRGVSLFGSASLIICVIYSGTRGAWIVLPVYFFVFLFLLIKRNIRNKRELFFPILLLISFFSVVMMFSKPILEQRYEQMKSDIYDYQNDDKNSSLSSVGGRFYIWGASIKIIEQHPMLGIGVKEFRPYIDRLAAQGVIEKDTQGFLHSHNEFIYSFVTKGVFGLLSYLIIYFFPLYIAYTLRYRPGAPQNGYSVVSVLIVTLCLSYGVLALSDVPLKYPVNIFQYSLVTYFMISKLSVDS